MFRLVSLFIILITLSACGVETYSSKGNSALSELNNTNPTTPDDGGDTPDDGGDTPDDGGDTPDDGGDTPDDGGTTPLDQNQSIFSIEDAVEDKLACYLSFDEGYTSRSKSDSSSDNLATFDLEHGVGIQSNFSPSAEKVVIYYYDLKPQLDDDMTTIRSHDIDGDGKSSDFILYVDKAWATNEEKILYVRTPKDTDGLYGCYRYDISNIDTMSTSADINVTKVYKLTI